MLRLLSDPGADGIQELYLLLDPAHELTMPPPCCGNVIAVQVKRSNSVGMLSVTALLVEVVLMARLSISLVVTASSVSHFAEAARHPDWLWVTECVVSQWCYRLQRILANTPTAC